MYYIIICSHFYLKISKNQNRSVNPFKNIFNGVYNGNNKSFFGLVIIKKIEKNMSD